jgi:tetrahydromethanopterin S-methyltransferase subunit E
MLEILTNMSYSGNNFGTRLEGMSFGILEMIQRWKCHILTPIGRITVAKTLIIPKLNHLFETISNLTTQLFKFIWGSNCDKIKRTIAHITIHLHGGLNMK